MSVAKTASASETKGFDLKRSLLETLVAGLLALIVFGPVVAWCSTATPSMPSRAA